MKNKGAGGLVGLMSGDALRLFSLSSRLFCKFWVILLHFDFAKFQKIIAFLRSTKPSLKEMISKLSFVCKVIKSEPAAVQTDYNKQ
jgi:hypothetical protein